ncbi:NrtR DNA-binding winged helix domain-containing protein [Actinacidiphila bryophytorum]|uniref:NrtR DNA-binding winged helix domain-containing protein n=1 Tax=Actinacidiphila bryophytorum TaxID=1436133 RepID=UPI00396A595A
MAFCGESFALGELPTICEVIWGQLLDPSNFRRKVLNAKGLMRSTGNHRPPPTGRPAAFYRRGEAWLLSRLCCEAMDTAHSPPMTGFPPPRSTARASPSASPGSSFQTAVRRSCRIRSALVRSRLVAQDPHIPPESGVVHVVQLNFLVSFGTKSFTKRRSFR